MIPKILHEHINGAFPANVCLIGVVMPDGYAQISPRGSTMVYDEQHLALWERGKGSALKNLIASAAARVVPDPRAALGAAPADPAFVNRAFHIALGAVAGRHR